MQTYHLAIENACATLPDGWQIHLHAENGAAWVELEAPGGVMHEPAYLDDSLPDKIEQLTAYAIKNA